ncbi:hypothetical protein [Synechococcus sp. MIT S9504]|uniref:hypothetical protein n=1 Tax=Synechococcus sp. MIT S9504 TaxID=1801628 RepID=UPI0008335EC2
MDFDTDALLRRINCSKQQGLLGQERESIDSEVSTGAGLDDLTGLLKAATAVDRWIQTAPE